MNTDVKVNDSSPVGNAVGSTGMVTIPRCIIDSVFTLLEPYCPHAAMQMTGKETRAPQTDAKHCMTRAEAAAMLSVSLNTLNRYVNQGKLRKIVLSPHSVRIDYKSVEELLEN